MTKERERLSFAGETKAERAQSGAVQRHGGGQKNAAQRSEIQNQNHTAQRRQGNKGILPAEERATKREQPEQRENAEKPIQNRVTLLSPDRSGRKTSESERPAAGDHSFSPHCASIHGISSGSAYACTHEW